MRLIIKSRNSKDFIEMYLFLTHVHLISAHIISFDMNPTDSKSRISINGNRRIPLPVHAQSWTISHQADLTKLSLYLHVWQFFTYCTARKYESCFYFHLNCNTCLLLTLWVSCNQTCKLMASVMSIGPSRLLIPINPGILNYSIQHHNFGFIRHAPK